MAKILQVVYTCGPKVKISPTAQMDQVAGWMSMRTELKKNIV